MGQMVLYYNTGTLKMTHIPFDYGWYCVWVSVYKITCDKIWYQWNIEISFVRIIELWWKYRLWSFCRLEKAFDTVDYQTLLAKLNHYGIPGVSNDWFKSYLPKRNQRVSINGYESCLAALNCGFPPGSVLQPLVFLQYTNDFNQAIKFCKVHHSADEKNWTN